MIGFVATAYLTLILVVVHYLLDCSPEFTRNPIDRGTVAFIRNKLSFRPSEAWAPTLQRSVLMFSDQQLVTGIAILAAGFSQLTCGISTYDWQVIVDLAWFSSITHLTTLIMLQQYFWKNSTVRWWRITLMLILAAMQVAALVPMANVTWPPFPSGEPAVCGFNFTIGQQYHRVFGVPSTVIISLTYIFLSYFTRVVKLFRCTSTFARQWLRIKPGNMLKVPLEKFHRHSCLYNASTFWTWLHMATLVIFTVLRAMSDIYESILWEVRRPSTF